MNIPYILHLNRPPLTVGIRKPNIFFFQVHSEQASKSLFFNNPISSNVWVASIRVHVSFQPKAWHSLIIWSVWGHKNRAQLDQLKDIESILLARSVKVGSVHVSSWPEAWHLDLNKIKLGSLNPSTFSIFK